MGRLTWRRAVVVGLHDETATARTLTIAVDGWTGHRPGQHVDVRLTAPDGYSAIRPYSMAAPAFGPTIEITVEMVADGEVSSYLVSSTNIGTELDVRGPLGGWFVWNPMDLGPVQLLGGGVGVSPLIAMLRAHDRIEPASPMRLLYSARSPETVLYARELSQRAITNHPTAAVNLLYTRSAPETEARPAHRITSNDVATYALPPSERVRCYVCGPTGFVERGIALLESAGFAAKNIRAERFG